MANFQLPVMLIDWTETLIIKTLSQSPATRGLVINNGDGGGYKTVGGGKPLQKGMGHVLGMLKGWEGGAQQVLG